MAVSDSSSGTLSANAKKRTAPRVSLERRRSRTRRHARLRKKVIGTPARPRLVVSRSSRHMVAQLIDDKKAKAAKVGELLAARAREAGVTAVVFDRGGYLYHGRIAALADAAREGGLEF